MNPNIPLTVTQLRNILQLPERPYEDVYVYDGTTYFDFSHREISTLLVMKGTAAGASYTFINGTDFQITAGTIDWSPPAGTRPDLFTPFTIDYTYSRLSGDTASTSVANANLITTQDLGSKYPYGTVDNVGQNYNDIAVYGASLAAAREACYSLANSDIDLAQKSRRGSVLQDDSKKTTDWTTQAQEWDMRYKRYLVMIRGMVRGFNTPDASPQSKVFREISGVAYDVVFRGRGIYTGYDLGGPF